MNKTLFCGVDLHSNNAIYVITDQEDQPVLKKRLVSLCFVCGKGAERWSCSAPGCY
jgi:hypothetical protein